MALFRGQNPRQRSNGQGHRERYKGHDRRRGRREEGRAQEVRAGHSSTFHASRVREQPGDVPEEGSAKSEWENRSERLSSCGEESEEEEVPSNANTSYKTLLQALNANVQREGPPWKKRKIDGIEAPSKAPPREFAPEEVVELEDDISEPDEDGPSRDAEETETAEQSAPFAQHFETSEECADLSKKISAIKGNRWHIQKEPIQGKWGYSYRYPESSGAAINQRLHQFVNFGSLPLKERLKAAATRALPQLDPLTSHVTSSIFTYRDVFFPLRNLHNADILRKVTCLHALNHVFTTRDKIIKNNSRLGKEDGEADLELRDQGFTRPKILIILPTRQSCVRYVDAIVALCEPEQQENKKRFQESFESANDHFSEDKPDDFRELFAGNDDDMFRLGMKFTRKTIQFFSQFYKSDIIIASPLGLRIALGADDPKKRDYDFLSSIEIVIVDQAEALLMQNWVHVEHVFENLSLQPKEAHGCDFSRVKYWYLDGNAKYLRQTIVFSTFNFPVSNKLYIQHMLNIDGKVKYSIEVEGAMIGLGASPKQTFTRFEYMNPVSEPNDRFKYFSTAVVPSFTKGSRRGVEAPSGVLIYVPVYADFVRIRNYLATSSTTQDISFGSISEYTSVKDVARARSHFLSGRHSVLLYTERAHHFRRYHLKGVKRIIMYGLPENPTFYREVVGGYFESSIAATKLDAREASVRVLFSKLDMLKLERIVGSSRYLSMLKEKGGDTFDFM